MSYGQGDPDYSNFSSPSYYCGNCGSTIVYPYKWRLIDESTFLTKDLRTIKSRVVLVIDKNGSHIRICDYCDELFTTSQLIELFNKKGIGIKGRKKEKNKKWNEREEKKRQKVVNEFGRKILIYELCPDCGGTGEIWSSPGGYLDNCEKCFNGEITKLISIGELKKLINKEEK